MSPKFSTRLTTEETDLVIEGFPRSANSFMLRAFALLNPTARVAHHVHVPMQIIKAVALDIPAILLIRDPLNALSSLLIVDRRLSLPLAIRSYINFYERVHTALGHVVIAPFDRVIDAPHCIIQAVNDKFGTGFHARPLTDDDIATIFGRLRNIHQRAAQPENLIAIPDRKKEHLKAELNDLILNCREYPAAVAIFQEIIARSSPTH